MKVILQRPLTSDEKLLRAFDGGSDTLDLEMKKGFFYLINPQGKVIDCAQIYSFLHEKNIFKRITAKVCKDVDETISTN